MVQNVTGASAKQLWMANEVGLFNKGINNYVKNLSCFLNCHFCARILSFFFFFTLLLAFREKHKVYNAYPIKRHCV